MKYPLAGEKIHWAINANSLISDAQHNFVHARQQRWAEEEEEELKEEGRENKYVVTTRIYHSEVMKE